MRMKIKQFIMTKNALGSDGLNNKTVKVETKLNSSVHNNLKVNFRVDNINV